MKHIIALLNWKWNYYVIRSTWKFFTGVIITVVGFATIFTDFKQPEVSVEITSVATTSTEPIDILRIPELSALRRLVGDGPFPSLRRDTGLTPDAIERQLGILGNQLATQNAELEIKERQFNSLLTSPVKDQESALNDLSKDFFPIGLEEIEPSIEKKKPQTAQERIDLQVKRVRRDIDSLRKQLSKSVNDLKEAEKQWTVYKDTVLPNRARLIVTCAVGNKGAGATSLKPQGLLRANLGDGNYLDLVMKMSGYETSADLAVLQSQSFKVIRYQSDELQSMNPADRQRFKTFLGNVSPATIFVADVRGRTYQSNSVPFSPGVYEQKVYDTLKQYASKAAAR